MDRDRYQHLGVTEDEVRLIKRFKEQIEMTAANRAIMDRITPQMLRCLSGHHDCSELATAMLRSPTRCIACNCIVYPAG